MPYASENQLVTEFLPTMVRYADGKVEYRPIFSSKEELAPEHEERLMESAKADITSIGHIQTIHEVFLNLANKNPSSYLRCQQTDCAWHTTELCKGILKIPEHYSICGVPELFKSIFKLTEK
ncbi:MAG TPA: hypothetical protein DCE41_09955 [Cytophagales bacterium]|nr:hypothetical protein [Cytophagales bacterium]HAP64763.1 hypothetical protein [Cytophagales bacterium]